MTISLSLEELTTKMIDRIVLIAEEERREFQKLIDFILYPHTTYKQIVEYTNDLILRLDKGDSPRGLKSDGSPVGMSNPSGSVRTEHKKTGRRVKGPVRK